LIHCFGFVFTVFFNLFSDLSLFTSIPLHLHPSSPPSLFTSIHPSFFLIHLLFPNSTSYQPKLSTKTAYILSLWEQIDCSQKVGKARPPGNCLEPNITHTSRASSSALAISPISPRLAFTFINLLTKNLGPYQSLFDPIYPDFLLLTTTVRILRLDRSTLPSFTCSRDYKSQWRLHHDKAGQLQNL
jgi:hypothetical protein